MEEVGRCGKVTDEPVNVMHLLHFKILVLWREVPGIIIAHLQETLNTSAGVLWTLCVQEIFTKGTSIFCWHEQLRSPSKVTVCLPLSIASKN